MEVKFKATASTLARLEIAREKTRIMEEKLVIALSELEQAAEKWKNEVERWR